MLHLKLRKIPENHIVKHWTKDACDVLPEKLLRYQKDQGPPKMASFRHTRLYIKALKCVQLGDSNVNCYGVFLGNAGGSERKASSSESGMGWYGPSDHEAAEADMGTAENLVDDDVGDCVSDGTQVTI
jgi:hypothetical protein